MTYDGQTLAVGALLALWVPIALALTAFAERRIVPPSAPPPSFWKPSAACALLIVVALAARSGPSALACGIACLSLAVAAFADARTGFLFDAITLPAAVLTALAVVACGDPGEAARGVVVLVGGFGGVVALSRGRLLGLGDVKALYAVGAAFGPWEGIVAIFGACISGIAAVALAGRLRRGTALPFGPHLAVGSGFALALGDPIVHRFLGL
jgi:prepilin signal peptidase PulO-like enzyme (type II secretory pathway)